jgi:predicted GNAT family acetyltransferase
MICGPGELRPGYAPDVTVHDLRADAADATLADFIRTTRRGFGLEPSEPDEAEVAEQRSLLAREAQRLAYATIEGRMAAVAVLQASAELGGVATLPVFGRRGAAAAVSHHLAALHLGSGGKVVWLSAGDEAAHGVYAKIGFTGAGAVLHYIADNARSDQASG